MQRRDQRRVELEHRLAAGDHHQPFVPTLAPQPLDLAGELAGTGELAPALAVGPDEIGVAESALRGGAVGLAPGPQVAAGKAQEHRAAARLHAFTLEGQEAFLDGVAHA